MVSLADVIKGLSYFTKHQSTKNASLKILGPESSSLWLTIQVTNKKTRAWMNRKVFQRNVPIFSHGNLLWVSEVPSNIE